MRAEAVTLGATIRTHQLAKWRLPVGCTGIESTLESRHIQEAARGQVSMPLALTHKCIASYRSELSGHSRFRRPIIIAVALAMAATIISGLLPLSAEAQTPPQPLTPQPPLRTLISSRLPAGRRLPILVLLPLLFPILGLWLSMGLGLSVGVGMAYRSFGRVWRLL